MASVITKYVVGWVMHEANRALCAATGDESHLAWKESGLDTEEHFLRGVDVVLNNPTMTAKDGHDFWLNDHMSRGWTWGPVKDRAAKKHPCIVPYDDLSEIDKAKDRLYIAIVRALLIEK